MFNLASLPGARFISKLSLLLTIIFVLSSIIVSAATVVVNGDLNTGDSFDGCDYYDLFPFYVDAAGAYTFDVTSPVFTFDTYMLLFTSVSDAQNRINAIAVNDDDFTDPVSILHSLIANQALAADTLYVLRMEGFGCVQTGAYQITFSGPGNICFNAPCGATAPTTVIIGGPVMPSDDRINWQYGDLHAVLYRSTDSDGNPAIDTYCWDGDDSWLGMRSDSSSASGTTADGCNATFYILSDGTYQFNILFDGKRYEIRCEDFGCASPDMSYFDPNE